MPKTTYIWDFASDSYLMEQDGDGNTTAVYTTEPVPYGRVISQRRGDTTSYYHFDGQGSTRQLTDQSANVTDEYTYSAFGETVASSGTTVNPFRYVGRMGYLLTSALDIYYVRARTYNTSLGRWQSCDPTGLADGTNRYAYATNQPTSSADPSGLQFIPILKNVLSYGRYCGPVSGPGLPIDPLDTCCQTHDSCYATCKVNFPTGFFGFSVCARQCDRSFCGCLILANCVSPVTPSQPHCMIYKAAAIDLFCTTCFRQFPFPWM